MGTPVGSFSQDGGMGDRDVLSKINAFGRLQGLDGSNEDHDDADDDGHAGMIDQGIAKIRLPTNTVSTPFVLPSADVRYVSPVKAVSSWANSYGVSALALEQWLCTHTSLHQMSFFLSCATRHFRYLSYTILNLIAISTDCRSASSQSPCHPGSQMWKYRPRTSIQHG